MGKCKSDANLTDSQFADWGRMVHIQSTHLYNQHGSDANFTYGSSDFLFFFQVRISNFFADFWITMVWKKIIFLLSWQFSFLNTLIGCGFANPWSTNPENYGKQISIYIYIRKICIILIRILGLLIRVGSRFFGPPLAHIFSILGLLYINVVRI